MEIYVVQRGDSVDAIAARYGVDVQQLIHDNQLVYPYRLAVGQSLYVSGPRREGKSPLEVNGYAYPFISPWVLRQTLPYISDLSIFSYGFTAEGNLVPPLLDDEWMIGESISFEVRPILTLTPLGPDGRFNNNLVSMVVRDDVVQQNLIWQLGLTLMEKGFGGVDIDFEYVLSEDREDYVRFVSRVRNILNVFGYQVFVTLAPKTSADQRGLLYEGIDYRGLGEAADRVLLMTYEWGYTYGPPMAVAPLNMVRRVVDYALTEIPREKILMGIPNYGYDWPLPYERGVTRARTVGNIEAVQLAIEFGAEIQFDETAQTPYFYYQLQGVSHVVWFEDVRSLRSKFRLIREYGLRGAGYWQIMQLFRANWLLLNDMFRIEKYSR